MHETQWQTPQPLIAEAPRAIVADVEEKEVDEGAFTPEEEQVILSAISGTRTAAAAIDALNECGFYPLAITSSGTMEPIGPEESIDYILTDPLQYETKVSGSRIVYLYVTENTDVEDALNKFDTLPQQLSAVKELGYTVSIANAANYDDGKPDEHPDRYQMSSDAPQIDRRANTVTLYATPLRSESEIEAERKAEEEARKQAEAEAAERARQQAAAEEAQRRAQAEAEARAQQQAQQQTQGKSHYRNCKDVWETLGHGITSDDPGYSRKLDRDGDGFACEIRPSY
ncbi:excalibur calcium-binding domain-containing protein [Bifidobacterium pseudolongum]|nr:excalibur calcium-binding domain-containing protein [Bifidobacterium pseudolongum]